MTSDNPIPSSMQLCYSPKKLRKFQENKLKCLGINLTGLTVMPVHDGAAAIHVGVSRHVPALQVPLIGVRSPRDTNLQRHLPSCEKGLEVPVTGGAA